MQLPLSLRIDHGHWLARLLCRNDIEALNLGADGRLVIVRRSGAREEAEVDGETTVFARFVILRMRLGHRRQTLVLPPSAIGVDAHRRLRVWLRWRALPRLFKDAV
ncbi:MAG: hypothetical protein ACK4Q4_07050 [Rhodocyclaceae bacterium]